MPRIAKGVEVDEELFTQHGLEVKDPLAVSELADKLAEDVVGTLAPMTGHAVRMTAPEL